MTQLTILPRDQSSINIINLIPLIFNNYINNSNQFPIVHYSNKYFKFIPLALYQTMRNGVAGKEQYQINNPQNPTSFLYKYWTARKVDNATFTIGLPTKTTFDTCMAKQGHNRFVSRIVLYSRY